MKLFSVHRILEFKQSDFNNVANSFEEDFF